MVTYQWSDFVLFQKKNFLQAEIQYRCIAMELGQYREIMYEIEIHHSYDLWMKL